MNRLMQLHTLVVILTIVLNAVVGAEVAPSTPQPPDVPASGLAVSTPEPAFVDRLLGALPYGRFGAPPTPAILVVPAREIPVDEFTEILEDLAVMSRIFEDRLRQADLLPEKHGLNLFATRGYRAAFAGAGDLPRPLYLQDYGVLFFINVDLPLAPGPHVETEELVQPADEGDPVWVRTREELYQPQRPKRRSPAEDTAPKYSAERLETLKTTIINALVHAANMRHLSADEFIVVTLTGPTTVRGDVARRTIVVEPQARPEDWLALLQGEMAADAGTSSSTALTIRAKSADISTLAKGELTPDQFRQRVQVLSHPMVNERGAASVPTSVPPRSSGSR